ncbi:carboxypeptidase regulatory-like domain-containing protein [Marinobacter sp. UBA2678]|uniref:carboxypeptidase regulatory-like domain-containing protein n=1 Tax=Marinobacter sp. UBA2678 TaxID=1946815 RepID=UPI0032E3E878
MGSTNSLSLFSAIILTSALAGCGGSSGSSGTSDEGSPTTETPTPIVRMEPVSGQIRDYYTGEPVAGALVTLQATNLEEPVETLSGPEGRFSLEAEEGAGRATISSRATGYVTNSMLTSTTEGSDNDNLELSLVPAQLATSFSADSAATLSLENSLSVAELPANAFRSSNGSPYNGTVNTQITALDPSSDPTIIPGNYDFVDNDGQAGLLTSYGAVTFDFADENGEPLQLSDGSPATIRIPLASGLNPFEVPSSLPLAWFDQESGQWIEESMATLVDNRYYEGQVTHFTTWNAIDTYTPVEVSGRVVDRDGNPVAGASVRAQGYDYIGMNTTMTNADGTFSVPVRADSEVLISARLEATSNTREITVGPEGYTLDQDIVLSPSAVSITLTWGQNPSDLDSHLLGPDSEVGTSEFHVAFWDQVVPVGDTVIELDVDDVTSFGPEVITIPDFPFAGRYRYLVHLFAGTGTIENSPARVEFSINGETRIFSPQNAQGSVSDWWAVADIIVDESGDVRLEAVQEWREQGEEIAFGFSLNNRSNPAVEAAKRKYYSDNAH